MSENNNDTPQENNNLSAGKKRENTLKEIVNLLGRTKNKDERFNVGYCHRSLPVTSSFMRAFEDRETALISNVQSVIVGYEKIPDHLLTKKDLEEQQKINPENFMGQIYPLNRAIFCNTRTLNNWDENYYQESVAVEARSRDDLREIGVNAFKSPPAMPGFNPLGIREDPMKSDN